MHSFDSPDNIEKISRSYRLYNFPKIARYLNISCCSQMWSWSRPRSQEANCLDRTTLLVVVLRVVRDI